ncbi:MAG TPA: LemA family protein [Flavobacteriales bacterium]|nr:LemA family protein [Flavobacteriales bacterium]|tara:strand:- start:2611 stop:3246 length:636 start_codon:yes stop_codon:yes gene_type:complete
MKKFLPLLALGGVVLLFFLIFYLWGASIYDGAVVRQETVDQEWADVQAQYQRRADLIPQLVATVKGAADNEKEILITVTQARAGIVPGVYSPEQFTDKVSEGIRQAETPTQIIPVIGTMSRGRNFLMENYPEIKSTDNFRMLQTQLEGTENRVAIARENYNKSVKDYNSHVRGFFRSKALGMLAEEDDFPKRESFTADPETQDAPEVNFDD